MENDATSSSRERDSTGGGCSGSGEGVRGMIHMLCKASVSKVND